jgi:hypothetical protein
MQGTLDQSEREFQRIFARATEILANFSSSGSSTDTQTASLRQDVRELKRIRDQARKDYGTREGAELASAQGFIESGGRQIQQLCDRYAQLNPGKQLIPASTSDAMEVATRVLDDAARMGNATRDELDKQKEKMLRIKMTLGLINDESGAGNANMSELETVERQKSIIIWVALVLASVGVGTLLYFVFR